MNRLRHISTLRPLLSVALRQQAPRVSTRLYGNNHGGGDDDGEIEVTHDEGSEYFVPIPPYTPRAGETVELKRARLIYQSRKRGMLENGIILSTYASRYLPGMSESQLDMYDNLINQPSNDWDIFDWIIKKKPVPEEYQSEIMTQLQEHAQNKEMEERFIQPPLN